MKWLPIIIMLTLTITIASAEMCEDTVLIHEDCTMITPSISCEAYTYDILNATSDNPTLAVLEKDNPLTLLNNSIYYLNFTYTNFTGDYLILLCDYTSREVKVREDDYKMILAAIILMPLLIAFLMFYISTKLKGEDHWAISLGLMLLGFVFILVSWGIGIQVVAKYLDFPELQETLGTSLFGYGSFFYLIIVYFLIYIMIMSIRIIRNKKRAKTGDYNEKG